MRDPEAKKKLSADDAAALKEIKQIQNRLLQGHLLSQKEQNILSYVDGFMGIGDRSIMHEKAVEMLKKGTETLSVKEIQEKKEEFKESSGFKKLSEELPELAIALMNLLEIINFAGVDINDLSEKLTRENIIKNFPKFTLEKDGKVTYPDDSDFLNYLIPKKTMHPVKEQISQELVGLKVIISDLSKPYIQKIYNTHLSNIIKEKSSFKNLLILTMHLYRYFPTINGKTSIIADEFLNSFNINNFISNVLSKKGVSSPKQKEIAEVLEKAIIKWFKESLPKVYSVFNKNTLNSVLLKKIVGNPILDDNGIPIWNSQKDSLHYVFNQVFQNFYEKGYFSFKNIETFNSIFGQFSRTLKDGVWRENWRESKSIKLFVKVFNLVDIYESLYDNKEEINGFLALYQNSAREHVDIQLQNAPNNLIVNALNLLNLQDIAPIFSSKSNSIFSLHHGNPKFLSTFTMLLHLRTAVEKLYVDLFLPRDKMNPVEFAQKIIPTIIQNDYHSMFNAKYWNTFSRPENINEIFSEIIKTKPISSYSRLMKAFDTKVNFEGEYISKYGEITFKTTGAAEMFTSGLYVNVASDRLRHALGIAEVVIGDGGINGLSKKDPLYKKLADRMTWTALGLTYHSSIDSNKGDLKSTSCDQARIINWQGKMLLHLYEILDQYQDKATKYGNDAIASGKNVELNVRDLDGYIDKHNHEFLLKLLLGFPEFAISTENLYDYHLGAIIAKNPQDRFLVRFGPHISVNEFKLYLQLMNPVIMSEEEYMTRYPNTITSYNNYEDAIYDYREWVKNKHQDQNKFQEGLQDILNHYLLCLPITQNSYEIASRLYMQELVLSLQVNLGINPDKPDDLTWTRIIKYFNPSDYLPSISWTSIWRKGIKVTVFTPKPGPIISESIKIDRRLMMVVNNPEIEIDQEEWELSDLQFEILNRLKIQTIFMQNAILLDYNQELKIAEQWPLWQYTGVYDGTNYINEEFLNFERLSEGFTLITPEEIIREFKLEQP
ncbi:MAG: hypothetical protein ACTSRK_02900 [Promethearchaeota archaeon]